MHNHAMTSRDASPHSQRAKKSRGNFPGSLLESLHHVTNTLTGTRP